MFFFTDYNYERFKPCRSGLFRQLFWDYTYKSFSGTYTPLLFFNY